MLKKFLEGVDFFNFLFYGLFGIGKIFIILVVVREFFGFEFF